MLQTLEKLEKPRIFLAAWLLISFVLKGFDNIIPMIPFVFLITE